MAAPRTSKQDVLDLHIALCRLRARLEALNITPSPAFAAYDELGILPTHVHRTREAHIRAIQHLTTCLNEALKPRDVAAQVRL
jgi:hypothetical protein